MLWTHHWYWTTEWEAEKPCCKKKKRNNLIVLEARGNIASQIPPRSPGLVPVCPVAVRDSIILPLVEAGDLEGVHDTSFSQSLMSSPSSGIASFVWPSPYPSLNSRYGYHFPGLQLYILSSPLGFLTVLLSHCSEDDLRVVIWSCPPTWHPFSNSHPYLKVVPWFSDSLISSCPPVLCS